MSTVLNDRDVLLQGGTRNVDPSAGKALMLVPDTNAFHVTTAGAGSPASIVLRAQPLNIPGEATFSITAGATLTGSGNTRSLAFASMSVSQVTVTAQITYDGLTYTDTKIITKVVDGATGANGTPGTAGLANALAYAYQRSATPLTSNPGAVTYTFASASITTPSANALANGWTKAIPAGSDPLYITMAPASAIGTTDVIAAGEWSTPVKLAVDGMDGAPAVNSALIYIYHRAPTASAPTMPSASCTYTFASSALAGLNNGWTTTIPAASGGAYLYVSTAAAVSAGATDTIAAGEWAAAQLLAQDGAAGANGDKTATIYLYQWAATTPSAPAGSSTYTWATGVNASYGTPSDGWAVAVPANPGTPGHQLYTAAKPMTVAAGTTTSTVSYAGATIASVAMNGATGNTGAPGVRTAIARAYQWATSAPTASGSATWTWATASYNTVPVTGWSMTKPAAPSVGYTLYEVAVGLVDGTTATTTAINWSTGSVASIGYIGIDGAAGANAISAALSNDAHTVPTAADGTGGVFTGCASTMSIYNGATNDSANWTVAATPLAGVTGSLSGKTYTVTAMSVDVGYVDLVASRSGYSSLTARFTITKAKGGVTGSNGSNGSDGSDATAYWLVTPAAIQKSIAGVYTPATVTVSGYAATGTGAPALYAGRFIIATSTDGTSFTTQYTSSANESSKVYTPPAGIKVMRTRLYLAGGTTVLLDEELISVVTDGATGATGAAGDTGAGARIAYTLADTLTLNLTPATLSKAGTAKPTLGTWGETRAWVDQPTTAMTAGQAWFQSNGIYDGTNTVWGVPYLTNLKVGSLAAISANLGSITAGTITGVTMTAVTILGTTITGGVLQTAATGQRVVINDADNNRIQVYGNAGAGLEVLTDIGYRSGGSPLMTVGSFAVGNVAPGIRALSNSGIAVDASSYSNYAVQAESTSSFAVYARSTTAAAVYARSDSYAIDAYSSEDIAVVGDGPLSFAFYAVRGGYGPFTGSHDGLIALDGTGPVAGDIVVDGEIAGRSDVSNTISITFQSSAPMQKNVIGVFVSRRAIDPEKPPAALRDVVGLAFMAEAYDSIIVNAVGEGQINVCGEGGDIEAGDYITTSSTLGKGMRQADDLLHNYTVAKARESVTFTDPAEIKMIACTYHCG